MKVYWLKEPSEKWILQDTLAIGKSQLDIEQHLAAASLVGTINVMFTAMFALRFLASLGLEWLVNAWRVFAG